MEASSKVGDMPGLRVPTCFICAAVGETLQTVWGGSFVVGLRFLYIEKDSGVALQTWLDSLEASENRLSEPADNLELRFFTPRLLS
jgi:hypothetical protein